MKNREDIDRETLYDEVWRMPMFEVGAKYGLSRQTIKWACQELNVPLPPPAYWSHLRRGLAVVSAPPLPARSQRQQISARELRKREPKKRARSASLEKKKQEERRRLWDEQVDYEEFVFEAESWNRAESMRRYLAELDRRLASDGRAIEGYAEWRGRAERWVADLCPASLRVEMPESPPLRPAFAKAIRVTSAEYVTVALASTMTGLSAKAIRRKIEEGKWIEGKEFRRTSDGAVLISIQGFVKWVEGSQHQ
ncbi:hypothetical protein [Paraburkholderia sp. SIMBA_054]|uniref:hypothetical protein n=1 Tax=Paraburkholderia sp. SIMBA_054 TaxID=3085795 RepID=UPI00397A480A